MTGAAADRSPWADVDDLSCEVVETAADLLASLRKGYGDPQAAQPLRAFALSMCAVVAHLTEAEDFAAALTQSEARSYDDARSQLPSQVRAAWRSAVFALNTATALADSMPAPPAESGVIDLLELEPSVARMLALREDLFTIVADLEPTTSG